MDKINTIIMKRILFILLFIQISLVHYGQIIADHTVVDKYAFIPQQYIDEVKKMYFVIAGESHSLGYLLGLTALKALDPTYDVSVTYEGTPEAYTDQHLRASHFTWGDVDNATGWIASYGEEDWFTSALAISRTKAGITYCHDNNLEMSAFGFGWCYDGGILDATDYLAATQSYINYCAGSIATKIFFTTGPVDAYDTIGEAGYDKYLMYQSIRDYVKADPTRILFDYADILCYDDGNETPNTNIWGGHTFPIITTTNNITEGSGHISSAGELRLAKAIWWMLARIAGWDGSTTTGINSLKKETSPSALIEKTKDEIRIRLDESYLTATVSLYDLSGRIVAAKKVDSNLCIFNTSHLPSGMYLVVLSKSKIFETHKIIIQ
jgi:hypothetical protein